MFSISKDFHFSASHALTHLPESHKCHRLHGHNYIVRVTVEAHCLDSKGFVIDYGDLRPFGQWLDETCDHRDLNEMAQDHYPLQLIEPLIKAGTKGTISTGVLTTAENLARWFQGMVIVLVPETQDMRVRVSVSETPKTWATFPL